MVYTIESNITAFYRGNPHYSLQVISAIPQSRRAILTTLYRDTALVGEPCCSIDVVLILIEKKDCRHPKVKHDPCANARGHATVQGDHYWF